MKRARLLLIAAAAACVAAVALAKKPPATGRPERAPDRRPSVDRDPTLPIALAAGQPAGAMPMARIDGARSGRTALALPEHPRVIWRQRVATGAERGIAVDARGRIVVVSQGGQLTQLDDKGATEWTLRVGSAAPATAPALTSGDLRLVVTTAGEVEAIRASGVLAWERLLPGVERADAAEVLPMKDGGVVTGRLGVLVWLDASGVVHDEASIDDTVRVLLARASDVVAIGQSGAVWIWKPPLPPRRKGGLGGRPGGGAAIAGSSVIAVIDGERLVELDLDSGARHVRVGQSQLGLEGPPALLKSGETRVPTPDGLLLGHDAQGEETLRVALEPSLPLGDGGGARSSDGAAAPPVIVDLQGRVAFVRPGLDAGVVLSGGELVSAEGAACPDPIALVPAANRRLLLACRSGMIWSIGD